MTFHQDTDLRIFPDEPPAVNDTWLHGLPLGDVGNTDRHLILYRPTLQALCCLDNTSSDAAATYARSVTTGFTFTTSVTISVETSAEVSVEFVKVGFKVSTSLTFSSQWSKSMTETVNVTVPAGKRAFLYQGYIWSRVLAYNGSTFTWEPETARCLTNAVTTTRDPLPPST